MKDCSKWCVTGHFGMQFVRCDELMTCKRFRRKVEVETTLRIADRLYQKGKDYDWAKCIDGEIGGGKSYQIWYDGRQAECFEIANNLVLEVISYP